MTPWRPFPLMLAAASLACLVVIGPASADGHHRDRQVSVMRCQSPAAGWNSAR